MKAKAEQLRKKTYDKAFGKKEPSAISILHKIRKDKIKQTLHLQKWLYWLIFVLTIDSLILSATKTFFNYTISTLAQNGMVALSAGIIICVGLIYNLNADIYNIDEFYLETELQNEHKK